MGHGVVWPLPKLSWVMGHGVGRFGWGYEDVIEYNYIYIYISHTYINIWGDRLQGPICQIP
jgi:hypothetical protein